MLHAVQKNREAYLPLLLLADPSETLVRSYLHEGELLSWLTDEGETVGVMHLLAVETGVVEVKNLAVREAYQGNGHGKQFMQEVLNMLRARGEQQVLVRTGNSSIGNLAFYQKLGFRMTEIEADYFVRLYDQPIYEDGIQCRDRIHMACPL